MFFAGTKFLTIFSQRPWNFAFSLKCENAFLLQPYTTDDALKNSKNSKSRMPSQVFITLWLNFFTLWPDHSSSALKFSVQG
jgi:hypothetical protein